ncbi:MAG: glycosyl hydrolase family 28-related protein [Haloferacaceae archaeon]
MARNGAERERGNADESDGTADGDSSNTASVLHRRSYLALAGAAVAAVGGVRLAEEASAANQVSVVDYGADPSGSADSTGAIDDALADADDEVFFPEGTYLTGGGHDLNGKTVRGASRDGTVLQLTDSGELFRSGADGWGIHRMKWDVTHGTDSLEDMTNNEYLQCFFEHDGTLSDVWINGVQARTSDSGAPQVFAVKDADGTIRFERLYMPNGTGDPNELNALKFLGSFSDWGFTGTLEFVDCDVRLAANNFIYTESPTDGPYMDVLVDGCYFRNNNVGMRPPAGGTFTVRNTVIDNRGPEPLQDHSNDQYDGDSTGRGIWIPGYIGGDCQVNVENVRMDCDGDPGIDLEGGSVDVSGSTISGDPGVLAPSGSVVDSCVDGSIDGVSTDGVTSGCSPDLSPPVDLSPPYDGSGGQSTATGTDTSTDTATDTPTDTATDTPTDTATDTPTDTATDTPTDPPTDTPTGPSVSSASTADTSTGGPDCGR